MEERYVAVLDIQGGDRLFCSDRHRDEWTGRFGLAESFRALHEANEVASRHGAASCPGPTRMPSRPRFGESAPLSDSS
jgi:hypothetical protein